MPFSAKTTYRIRRIIPFGIIWLLLGWAFLWTEYALIGGPENTPVSAIKITTQIFVFASISIFIVGCSVGILEVFLVNRLFYKSSFPKKLVGKLIIYTILLFLIMMIFYMLAASIDMKISVFSKAVWDQYMVFFFSITHASTAIQIAFSLLLSLLYAEISDNIGQNILNNFFTGKYHHPVEESRIFMFVDMKDSTRTAERLGHKQYFKFLRLYYSSFSEAIINHQGEVYQYVGDEIVLTWPLEKGLRNRQCLMCYFEMKQSLKSKDSMFSARFGIIPDFKASMHCGEVTTGEIGALKKDIFFTGDVLNTTARIIGLSDLYKQDLLISKTLSSRLNLTEDYNLTTLGNLKLKGKQKSVEVIGLQNKTSKKSQTQ